MTAHSKLPSSICISRILITGICGFVGSTLARALRETYGHEVTLVGTDNLSRAGSWLNVEPLRAMGVRLVHGDRAPARDQSPRRVR